MGRPLEFKHDEVIDHAVHAFWREGYASISSNDLADAMGVAKSSLYNTYHSKKGVLLHAIAHYSEAMADQVRALGASEDCVGAVRALILDMTRPTQCEQGCLLVNMATELGSRDAQAQALVQSGFANVQKAFTVLLQAGQAAGTIKSTVDAPSYALSLVTGIAGIRVLAKSGFTEAQLAPFIDLLLSELA